MGRMTDLASTNTTLLILFLTVLLPIALCEDGYEALLDRVVVRNKLGNGRNNVVVTCEAFVANATWVSTTTLHNGEEVRIPVPYVDHGWGPTFCNTLTDQGFTRIYSWDKDHERCKVACFIEARENGLVRWNKQKKIWEPFW